MLIQLRSFVPLLVTANLLNGGVDEVSRLYLRNLYATAGWKCIEWDLEQTELTNWNGTPISMTTMATCSATARTHSPECRRSYKTDPLMIVKNCPLQRAVGRDG